MPPSITNAKRPREGTYIAAQLGHGPDLSIRVYQHVISEFEDTPRLGAEDAIRQAREGRAAQTASGAVGIAHALRS